MKRFATWAFYAIGAIAIAYLALYAYVMLTGRDMRPGAPIRIFKKPDAPSYSAIVPTPSKANSAPEFSSVMAGHSRSKNGVASLAYAPAIHVFLG